MSQHDALVDAIKRRKEDLQLSNEALEEACQLTAGFFDKVCGPSHVKNLSKFTIDLFCEFLAVDIVLVPNPAKEKRWGGVWSKRESRNVRVPKRRVSKAIMERAKPLFHKVLAKTANTARNRMLSSEHRSRIARNAALIRWRKRKKTNA